ncbi:MAG: GNAT family N-acetyltransferase [Rhodobacteraceae bacterium]|nr:GNAT family N-acetyltransferase [Paracoccaceae bacterium]
MIPALVNTTVGETPRLILRAPRLEDFEPFAAFCQSDRAAFVRQDDFDRAKAWRAFGHIVGHWVLRGFGLFVIVQKSTGRAIGTVGPWFPEGWPEREIGWAIWSAEAEGKGYAFEAAKAARDHVYRDLGWKTAVSYIAPTNARSIALAERLGAVRDDAAAYPGDKPCLVYRHQKPEWM